MLHIADLLRHSNSGLAVNAFHSRAMAHFNRKHADAPFVDRPLVKAERGCIDRDDESVAKTDHGDCSRHGVAKKARRELDVLNLHTRVPMWGRSQKHRAMTHIPFPPRSYRHISKLPSSCRPPFRLWPAKYHTHTHTRRIDFVARHPLVVCVCLHLVPRNSLRYWKPAWKRNRRAMRPHRGI